MIADPILSFCCVVSCVWEGLEVAASWDDAVTALLFVLQYSEQLQS